MSKESPMTNSQMFAALRRSSAEAVKTADGRHARGGHQAEAAVLLQSQQRAASLIHLPPKRRHVPVFWWLNRTRSAFGQGRSPQYWLPSLAEIHQEPRRRGSSFG